MKINRLAPALALLAALSATGCSVVGDRSGTAEVPHEVVARLGDDLEVRRYPARAAAEVRLSPGEGDSGDAFRALFAYITGANQPGAEIAMTAPVETGEGAEIAMTAPVETVDGAAGMRMRFFLPAAMTVADAPTPTDPRVRIVEVPARTEAALRFTGLADPEDAFARDAELRERLSAAGWEATGEVRAYFYDPPWTLPWLRRNEAVVPVMQVGG